VRGEKNSSPDWRVGLYFYSPILNSTRIWQVGECLSAHLVIVNVIIITVTVIIIIITIISFVIIITQG
jgi:hypothetical protein